MNSNTGMNDKGFEDQHLKNLFGEALGDLPTHEETQAAWEAFARKRQVRKRRLYVSIAGIAASIAILLTIWLPGDQSLSEIEVFASINSPKELTFTENGGTITVRTPPATTTTINLVDGTRVELSANSQLEYPKDFTDTIRYVKLIGKARFDVAKDPNHPFIVSSGQIQTRVLGTIFDINAYAHHAPQVTLYEGRVQVRDIIHQHTKDIHPGEQAILDSKGTIQLEKTSANVREGWVNGEFLFDNVELMPVMQEIGSWYNISVLFHSRKLLQERIYFRMDRHLSLKQTIEALNDLGIARFETVNNKIVVSL